MALLLYGLGNETTDDFHWHCPRAINCSKHSYPIDIGKTPSYVAIVSSTLSCLGSVLIFLAFATLKDLRTGSQKIITFLALADFISAAGYIVGSANYLVHFKETDKHQCNVFNVVCTIQASITAWSSLCSFAWTLILAFYFYLVIVYNRKTLAMKLMPFYHILAWVFPLFIIVPLIATKRLGYAPYAASNWCYVHNSSGEENALTLQSIGMMLLAGKFWEISTYIIVVVVYTHIICHLSQLIRRRHSYFPIQSVSVMEQAEKRLIYIPICFIILRIWGTTQFLVSIGLSSSHQQYIEDGCISKVIHDVFLALGILQAIGDPGQGWGNAILYVFLSPVVREKLFVRLCTWPWMEKLQTALNASVGHESGSSRNLTRNSSREKETDDGGENVKDIDESTVLSLKERPNGADYGSLDHRGGPINQS